MKFIKYVTIVMILFALITPTYMSIYAAELPSDISEQQLLQKIDAYVEEHKDTTAAVSVAVFSKENVIFEKSYGFANIENNLPNDADIVFEWGSVTKLLTWISVMQLVEQGKLDLNADILDYLPDGFLTKLNYSDKITMINLMNHDAGWQEACTEVFVDNPDKVRTLEDSLRLFQPAQIYRPGQTVGYSNFGVALAGYIVERISETPFYDYVKDNIFSPLGMEHTAIKPDLSDNLWVKEQRQKLNCYTANNQSLGIMDLCLSWYPAGSATGTISDMLTFGQALLPDTNNGTVLFKKNETLAELWEPTKFYPDGTPNIRHGMWELPTLAGSVVGHGGQTQGCSSYLLIDFNSGIGTVIMTNQREETIYNDGLIAEIFGEAKFRSETAFQNSASVAGLYKSSRNINKGFLKIFSLTFYVPISQNDDGSFFISTEMDFEQVDLGTFLLSEGDTRSLYYADYDENGQIVALRGYTTDYLRVSYSQYIFELITIFLLFIAFFYSLVYLIIALFRRIKKKKSPLNAWRLILCGAIIFVMINIFIIVILPGSNAATLTSVTISGISFILLGLIPVSFAAILVKKWRSLDLIKKQKAGLIIHGVMGLVVTFNIIFWQIWMFWI